MIQRRGIDISETRRRGGRRVGLLVLLLLLFVVGATACSDTSPPGGPGPDTPSADAGAGGSDGGPGPDGGGSGSDGGDPSPDGGGAGPDGGTAGGDGGTPDAGPDPRQPGNRARDTDCDALSDQEEFANIFPNGESTNPAVADTDGDGLPDGLELGRTSPVMGTACSPLPRFDADDTTRTSPVNADSDGDGIPDGVEDANRNGRVDSGETDPNRADSDDDRLPDGVEDANRNGRVDSGETDPTRADTDGDGILDGVEDRNLDGQRDVDELDPTRADTDLETLGDAVEDANANGVRERFETDGTEPDTDCDGIDDFAELDATPPTSPLNPDTDGDGIPDGVEQGVTGPVSGSRCASVDFDADPTTSTGVTEDDTDGDGLLDGVEDANRNGRVDPGETDPNQADSDMDGVSDGDEVRAGLDPLDPSDPGMGTRTGINDVCSDRNLKVVDFDVAPGRWTIANEVSTVYRAIAVSAAGSNVTVAALDDRTHEVAGFVLEMPLLGGPGTLTDQAAALEARIRAGLAAEGLTYASRASPRSITSHDGFPTAVSGLADLGVSSSRNVAAVRNAMLRLATNLPGTAFSGLPSTTGSGSQSYVYGFQVLLRNAQPQRLIVVGALLDASTFDAVSDRSSIVVSDLVNGTALARHDAGRDKDCDPFVASRQAVADFIWMADVSGSTDDDRGRIVQASNEIFQALGQNNVDFRMAVVPHHENDFHLGTGNGGTFRGAGFTTSQSDFESYLRDTSGTDGCEYGLEAASNAIREAPRSAPGAAPSPGRIRDGATLAVVYISDEFADEVQDTQCFGRSLPCTTGIRDLYGTGDNGVCGATVNQGCVDQIVQPYVQELQAEGAIAFAQILAPTPSATTCDDYQCGPGQERNEPGRGYVEAVNATGGVFYSPCSNTPGNALRPIIDAVTGAASEFQLTGNPISSTIRVGVVRDGATVIVPRDKRDGFDYDAAANSIFFRGATYRPALNEVVVVSYRLWEEPPPPCPAGQILDPALGICVCDLSLCNQNCSPNEICDSDCACACTPTCNGNCGPGEVCNQATCECECPADCGGCPAGTTCNQATCQCECTADCGGACANTLTTCNQATCQCECDDCGGACGGNSACNDSLCECVCPVDCNDACSGFAECDPSQDCACVCPTNCGDRCTGNATCDTASCACSCPPGCDEQCPGNEVCNPDNGCACECPADCGGCALDERCDLAQCACVPRN